MVTIKKASVVVGIVAAIGITTVVGIKGKETIEHYNTFMDDYQLRKELVVNDVSLGNVKMYVAEKPDIVQQFQESEEKVMGMESQLDGSGNPYTWSNLPNYLAYVYADSKTGGDLNPTMEYSRRLKDSIQNMFSSEVYEETAALNGDVAENLILNAESNGSLSESLKELCEIEAGLSRDIATSYSLLNGMTEHSELREEALRLSEGINWLSEQYCSLSEDYNGLMKESRALAMKRKSLGEGYQRLSRGGSDRLSGALEKIVLRTKLKSEQEELHREFDLAMEKKDGVRSRLEELKEKRKVLDVRYDSWYAEYHTVVAYVLNYEKI